jgi:type II secretion system protein J
MNLNRNFRRAFTLIEIMIAITIFALVLAAIYSVWDLILRSSKTGEEAAAQAQRQRIAVQTIENALTCIQSFQASIQYYSFIVQNGNQPLLSFVARLPDDFPRSGRFGDFNVRRLTFTVEAGANNENDLMLRQNPILMDMDADEQQHPLVLARNVKSFTIECWDTNQWDDEWDNTNSIPPMVRIGLVLGGNKTGSGYVSPEFAITRVVEIPSETLPTVVQTPRGGGVGIGGGGNGNRNPNPNNPNQPGPNAGGSAYFNGVRFNRGNGQ